MMKKMFKIPVSPGYLLHIKNSTTKQQSPHGFIGQERIEGNETFLPMNINTGIGGKLVEFCLASASNLSWQDTVSIKSDGEGDNLDIPTYHLPELMICSSKTKGDEILENEKYRISRCSDLDSFLGRCSILSNTANTDTDIAEDMLQYRECFSFQYTPLSVLNMSPSAWFMMEMRRARSLGLIYSVDGKTPHKPILESMGRKELHYCKKNRLIKWQK